MRTLTVISGPAAGTSMPVGDDAIVIGREDAALTIPDAGLSRQHASVRAIDGGIVVTDLGSMNGTFVNGTRIGQPVMVTSDATMRIGNSRIALRVGAPRRSAARQVPADVGVRAPTPPRRTSSATTAKRRPPPRKLILLLLVVGLAVAAAVVAAIVWAGGSSTSSHTLDASLRTLPLGDPTSALASGILEGRPLGRVEVIFLRQLATNPKPGGRPAQLTGTMLVLSSSGGVALNVRGTLQLTASGGEDVFARGTASNGTGDYKGAKGTFTLTGGRDNGRAPYGQYEINGTLDY